MSYAGGDRNLDHAQIAKIGFFAGVALFAVGAIGGALGSLVPSLLPDAAGQFFLALVGLGIVVALFVPILFGAVLPLIE